MTGRIYTLQADDTLRPLTEQPYSREDLLQELLAKYPDLLAGDQMRPDEPPRWLLVSRETGIPFEEGGGDAMSLDHLFLDQDGVPTLVEVKRASDLRIRREVVGQMLDYASHAVAFWSVDTLRARFESACDDRQECPDEVLAEHLAPDGDGDGTDIEGFWQQVGVNLRAGRVRLLFVADVIPPALRQVIEFLNRFMDPVQVLGVEVHQYVGDGLQALVPRLVGETAATQLKARAGRRPSRQWDEESFFACLEAQNEPAAVGVARHILTWARANASRVDWGKGAQHGSFVPVLQLRGVEHRLFAVYTYGVLGFYFQYLQRREPFDDEAARRSLLDKLQEIPGISLPDDAITRQPGLSLRLFTGQHLERLTGVLDWMVDQIQSV